MTTNVYIFINIVIPIITGVVFFALARYCAYIAPLRSLITGELTYRAAFWGFIAFGIYLASRPLQILLGPHPMPLIINNIREFFMIGFFGPGILIAEINLALSGERKLPLFWIITIFAFGMILATTFCITNIFAIGGAEEIFRIGSYSAYDGLWFHNMDANRAKLMSVLFAIRLTDPVIFLFVAGIFAIYRAFTISENTRKLYDNIPKKLIFAGIGTLLFSLSMLTVGFVWLLGKIPNQWWGYYLGALIAGVFETISISMPMRSKVEI